MKLKKKNIISILIVILIGVTCFLLGKSSNKEESYFENEPKQIKNEQTLSMMIEQTAGAGDYKMETRITWPTDGYMFNEKLSKCENGGILGWDSKKGVVTMTGNMSDKCYVYFDLVPSVKLAEYIINLYTGTQGENSIYYHNGTITSDDGTIIDAGDNSYRYAGASDSVNNYVCFGSDAEACPTDNLYRIIGVIDGKVKLIKSTLSGYMEWDFNNSNTWSTSSLNTYLNGTYLDTFSETWKAKISTITWKVGGNTWSNIGEAVPKTAYANEIISPTPTSTSTTGETEYEAKIGLMYISDYGFAADYSAWSTILSYYESYTSVNWMDFGTDGGEWTISRISDDISDGWYYAICVYSGQVHGETVDSTRVVRPVFYLTSSATYLDGNGEETNPIRIN